MTVNGDLLEVTYNHPTLGSGVFYPMANQTNTFDKGGVRVADDANAITGSGTMSTTKTRVRGHFEIVIENDMNGRDDAGVLGKLAEDPEPAKYTVSHINGTVWAGSGFPVGDIQPDTLNGNLSLKIGTGKFEKIVG